MKLVLVTGGAGFIGTSLCEELIAQGYKVRALDLKDPAHPVKGVEYLKGDCRDKVLLARSIEGAYAVYHFAAIVSVPVCQQMPYESYNMNFMATCEVIEAVRAESNRSGNKVRMLFAGSSVVYGDLGKQGVPISEDILLPVPLSFYGSQKLASEQAIRLYAQLFEIPSVTFRFFNVYGENQDPGSPYSGVITIFREAVRLGKSIRLNDSGRPTRDFIHVEDVARGCAAALKLPESECIGQAFNLGTSKSVSIKELATLMKDIKKSSSELIEAPARQGDVVHSQANISRAQTSLIWSPQVDLKQGLTRLIS